MKWFLGMATVLGLAAIVLGPRGQIWGQTSRVEDKSLRAAAGKRVQIGVAVNTGLLGDATYTGLIKREFGSVTAENCMKPASILKAPGEYDFAETDRFIEFAERNGIEVIGHTLVWHSQSPSFLFASADGKPLPRDEALRNMREYITKVVGRYRGRINGWDVVNEAVADGGGLRQTPALRAIGEDYLLKAFQYAAEADPKAELYYNDYNIELDYKRASGLELVRKLREAGARIDAVGIQGHYLLTSDMAEIQRGVKAYTDAGFKVMITELDVDVLPRAGQGGADVSALERTGMNPYVEGLPNDKQAELAAKYGQLFDFFLAQPNLTRITFWGATDAHTWLNGFPVRGRTNHPLLFDRKYQPKPAYDRVWQSLTRASG
ncbi:MAG: endo-1,4-beta-xylanase [Fimbriimonadaceae bacterium]|nr:endo-1,4-beta-xylanase [Fimbriimonadaceae bacterium]